MDKIVAKKLAIAVKKAAADFSRPDREFNRNKEIFHVDEISPLSSDSAAVYFVKEPSGKLAVAYFYYLNNLGGHWEYFFVTEGHVIGMAKMQQYLEQVEKHNYERNF